VNRTVSGPVSAPVDGDAQHDAAQREGRPQGAKQPGASGWPNRAGGAGKLGLLALTRAHGRATVTRCHSCRPEGKLGAARRCPGFGVGCLPGVLEAVSPVTTHGLEHTYGVCP
jgi:hypothetical protein